MWAAQEIATGLAKLAHVAAMAHLYNAVCEQRGVPPVARILSQLGSTHLALRYYNLGPRGAAPLAIVLGTNAYWRSLDLSDNCLSPQVCVRSLWLHLSWLHCSLRTTVWAQAHVGASVSRATARTDYGHAYSYDYMLTMASAYYGQCLLRLCSLRRRAACCSLRRCRATRA